MCRGLSANGLAAILEGFGKSAEVDLGNDEDDVFPSRDLYIANFMWV